MNMFHRLKCKTITAAATVSATHEKENYILRQSQLHALGLQRRQQARHGVLQVVDLSVLPGCMDLNRISRVARKQLHCCRLVGERASIFHFRGTLCEAVRPRLINSTAMRSMRRNKTTKPFITSRLWNYWLIDTKPPMPFTAAHTNVPVRSNRCVVQQRNMKQPVFRTQ